jgi:hypothetical protein
MKIEFLRIMLNEEQGQEEQARLNNQRFFRAYFTASKSSGTDRNGAVVMTTDC